MSAFRSGARGTADEAAPISPDVDGGLKFLSQLKPDLIFLGNHEARLWKLRHHYSAIVSQLAEDVCSKIEFVARKLKAELIPYHVLKGWRRIGSATFAHGYWFNQMSTRDTCEFVGGGQVVTAHTHTASVMHGRTLNESTGYSTGCLCQIELMDYAAHRRQTAAWTQGLVYGEWDGRDTTQLWLHDNGRNQQRKPWRLPRA
jgi:hypothetical protein